MPEITTEDFMFASEFFLVNSLPPDFESWADNQLDDYLTNNASEMVETHPPDFIWESIETLARGVVRYAGSRKEQKISSEVFTEFFNLLMELEPENLWMDGEASKAEVKRREKNILLRWNGLEKTVGRSVSQEEIWKMYKEKENE